MDGEHRDGVGVEIAAVAHGVRLSGAARRDYPLGEAVRLAEERLQDIARCFDRDRLHAVARLGFEIATLEHTAIEHLAPGPQHDDLLDLARRLRSIPAVADPTEDAVCLVCFQPIRITTPTGRHHLVEGPASGSDEDDRRARSSLAVHVSASVVHDAEARQPLVVFENSARSPVFGLAVFCFHHASLISRTYLPDETHQGRKTLTEFSALLARFYGGDPELAQEAQLAGGCSFRDAAGRWWSRPAEAHLAEAEDGTEAWWRAFTAPPGRTGAQMWQIVD